MYYTFNEDTNPFTRVSGLSKTVCECSERETIKPHFPPPSDPFTERDPYSEEEARHKVLSTEPVCFAIIGKPGLNSKKLAKFIAEYWNCVLISPDILLSEEIEAKTDKGRWMKQVLRSGRSIGPEIIMNLVYSRLNGRDTMHRGYVVEGIPLIPNDPDLDYNTYPDASSIKIPFTVNRAPSFVAKDVNSTSTKSENEMDEVEDLNEEEMDEEVLETDESFSSDSSRSYDLARNPFATDSLRMILRDDYQWDIENQMEEMFTTWPLKPSVIIYVMCPDADAVHRRSQFRLNPYTGNTIDTGLWMMDRDRNGLATKARGEFDGIESIELDEEIADEEALVDQDLKKHLLMRVSDMRSNVEVQCRLFERYALPHVEKRVLMHNPQNVIRVDGRTSATSMFQVVRVRLRTLPLPTVILPRKMYGLDETLGDGEESVPSTIEDSLDEKSNEEALEDLAKRDVVAPRFRWGLSKWKFTCPVALAKGKRIEGSAKNAVRFMNKLYFLSSTAAVETFVENPRPFLLPPNPRPVCKILIYGPEYSGKSKLAEYLVQAFGGRVLHPKAIEDREIEHKRNVMMREAIDDIVDDVIKELAEDLVYRREEREAVRIEALDNWHKAAQVVAEKLIRILGEGDRQNHSDVEDKLEEIKDDIEQYNLMSLCADHDLCDRILQDTKILLDYAPAELLATELPVRELDEQDPEVAAILAERTQAVQQASIKLTNDDIGQLIAANIKAAQSAPNPFGLEESGWVVDGMYVNVEVLENLLEKGVSIEEAIVIHETEPYKLLSKKWLEYYTENFAKPEVHEMENEDEEEEIVTVGVSGSNSSQYVEGEFETVHSKSSTEADLGTAGLNEYMDELKQFEANWDGILQKVLETGARLVDVDLSTVDDVATYVNQQIEDRYHFRATVMTDEEKGRAAEDANATLSDGELDEEEEDEETAREPHQQRDNRRFGDTGVFCPVALLRHNVLLKGKEEFSAHFMDKIYLLSSQEALDEFVLHPREFVPCKKPPESLPSVRVSVVGPIGSGKSTLAMAISKEYGLAHIDISERLDKYLKDRGFLPVGNKHDDIFSSSIAQETDIDLELPDDLNDQRYNCDGETIQAFVKKYLDEGAALPKRMLKECLTDFFKSPYHSIGLVIDDFPASSHDAETAFENFAVPELVLELTCSEEEVQARMTSKLFDAWAADQEKKKSDEEQRFASETAKVAEIRKQWVSKKLKELRRRRRAELLNSAEYDTGDEEEEHRELGNGEYYTTHESDSFLESKYSRLEYDDSSDSGLEDPDEGQAQIDRMNLEEESLSMYEDPVKFDDWEDPETVRDRIEQTIDRGYEASSEKLAGARTIFEEQSIPWIEIDAERNEASVLVSALRILDPYVFRNASALERVHEVDVETAERLLDCGYYLLSSFGRSCPVQTYENKVPFQMFLPAEAADDIHPVLHREYVYFIVGKEKLIAFLEHPLKYLDQDSCTPSIPARISIIGPPKCGKSTIANRFARTYGMKVVTRGQALRHMLKNFSWTELAILTSNHLQGGHTALDASIARAVELHSIDPRSASQGYVLDGFPESRSEAEELAFLGIQPMIVIDLHADLDFCLSCLSADSQTLTRPPAYSPCYLSHQYEEWQVEADGFRIWLSKFTQNVVTVDATAQKFAVWKKANSEVCSRFGRIKKYFREADCDKAQSLTFMCVSPYEFRERQSKYESYCPVCLSFDDALTFSGSPPSHTGMVQFREHFYWVCASHLDHFLKDPSKILSSTKDTTLLMCRPEIVDHEIDVNHACWAKRLKVNGFCPVTYLDNLPNRKVVPGLNTLGVVFREDLYLFCSVECRDKFVSQPTKYSDVDINFRSSLPPLKIKSLPNLGFLEQTVARLIVRAVNKMGGMRVKLPGMSPTVTAAVYIGVYLKIHNKDSDLDEITVYEEVMRRMDARRHLIQVALRNAKKMINPHVSFPPQDKDLHPKVRTIPPTEIASSQSAEFRETSSTEYFILEEYCPGFTKNRSFV